MASSSKDIRDQIDATLDKLSRKLDHATIQHCLFLINDWLNRQAPNKQVIDFVSYRDGDPVPDMQIYLKIKKVFKPLRVARIYGNNSNTLPMVQLTDTGNTLYTGFPANRVNN